MSILCKKCNTLNRQQARFCKHCGEKIPLTGWEAIFGNEQVKDIFIPLIEVAKTIQTHNPALQNTACFNAIFMGNTGTGKSLLINTITSILEQNKLTKKQITYIDAVDFDDFIKDKSSNFNKAKNGVLFIDNVHKLVQPGYGGGRITDLDNLMSEIDKSPNNPIVFLAGFPKGFGDYIDSNADIIKRFPYIFRLADFNPTMMGRVAVSHLSHNNLNLSDQALQKASQLFVHVYKHRDDRFANAFTVQRIVNEWVNHYYLRGGLNKTIEEEDIIQPFDPPKTTEQIMASLDEFIGMTNIKTYIQSLVNLIEVNRKDTQTTGKQTRFNEHMILTGNPGTGKTTIARKLGEVMASIGFLESGHVVETDRSRLVARFIGQTAGLVQEMCDQAIGGILFIDEAYTLKQSDDDNFGQEAIDTLMKRMEDDRGNFMVIAAGYPKEMQSFIEANPGLKSRFKLENFFQLDDYNPDELTLIFKGMTVKQGLNPEPETLEIVRAHFEDMYTRRDKTFGNAREARNFLDRCLVNRANRIRQTGTHDMIIRSGDVPPAPLKPVTRSLDEILGELKDLIGLDTIKKEVESIARVMEIQQFRKEQQQKVSLPTLHFAFKGNPGTGKTTVARILADIFKATGVLPKGHLVETDRKDLVVGFVGQTAPKTTKVIDSAMGGVLFIDEAYALVSGGAGDFGPESVNTLLKRMDDDRGKFIVIAAGYPDEMNRFLNSNPGLPSRFTKHIFFDDYSPQQLLQILVKISEKQGYIVHEHCHTPIVEHFKHLTDNKDRTFANGRTARNLLESAIQNQALRLSALRAQGVDIRPLINQLEAEDFKNLFLPVPD